MPEGKFKVDEHTIALWHFNGSPWAGRFKDESENGYDLWKSDVMSVDTSTPQLNNPIFPSSAFPFSEFIIFQVYYETCGTCFSVTN